MKTLINQVNKSLYDARLGKSMNRKRRRELKKLSYSSAQTHIYLPAPESALQQTQCNFILF
jgi:hypothetical protein